MGVHGAGAGEGVGVGGGVHGCSVPCPPHMSVSPAISLSHPAQSHLQSTPIPPAASRDESETQSRGDAASEASEREAVRSLLGSLSVNNEAAPRPGGSAKKRSGVRGEAIAA